MESIAQPLRRLVESVQWFAVAREIRLLHVTTTPALRLAVLEHVAAGEHHPDNRSPFFVLESPTDRSDDGWADRAEELRADYAELRATLAQAGEAIQLPEPWAPHPGSSPLVAFGAELGEALRRLPAPLDGLMLVLAPVWVHDPPRFADGVRALLSVAGLERVRLVVVEGDGATCARLADSLGPQAERVDARIDEQTARADMAELLAAMAAAPAGASGAQLTGAAGPAVAPPPRPRAPPPLSPAEREQHAVELGVPPALLDPAVPQAIRVKVLTAAQALREGDAPRAVATQREARDLCLGAGLVREATVMELVLGGFVLQAGQPAQALEVFQEARRRAEAAGLPALAAQAQLSTGSVLLALKREDEAALAYARAGRMGTKLDSPALAVEAFRLCGQLRAAAGWPRQAALAWNRALEVAGEGSPEEQRASSAPEVARQLAALCREYDLDPQADGLEAQADALEAAEAPDSYSPEVKSAATTEGP
jgi:hypothetical protein